MQVLKAEQLVKQIGRDLALQVVTWLETELAGVKNAAVSSVSAGPEKVFVEAVRAEAIQTLALKLKTLSTPQGKTA